MRYPVSEAVAKTRRELGGPLTVSSDAEMLCGRHIILSGSVWGRLNWFAHTQGKDFVRMQELSGEPLIFLAKDNQLADLLRFCTQDLDFSHLSVDPTFNFGDLSVTPTSYRKVQLKELSRFILRRNVILSFQNH